MVYGASVRRGTGIQGREYAGLDGRPQVLLPTKTSDGPLPAWTISPTWRRRDLRCCSAAISGRPSSHAPDRRSLRTVNRQPQRRMAEAAFAGALASGSVAPTHVRRVLRRPALGDGRLPVPEDIRRAVRLDAPLLRVSSSLISLAERVPWLGAGHSTRATVITGPMATPCRGPSTAVSGSCSTSART